MQYVRTLGWVILTAFVVMFLMMNWTEPQEVRIWPASDGNNFLVEWPVGIIAIAFFLLGLVPMWLYHRGVKWRLSRRISSLENAVKANALTRHEPVSSGQPPSTGPADPETPAPATDTLNPSSD